MGAAIKGGALWSGNALGLCTLSCPEEDSIMAADRNKKERMIEPSKFGGRGSTELGGPRPIDLGYYVICLESDDVEKSAAFYRRLGFEVTGFNVPNEVRTLVQGHNQLAFFGFYQKPNVNFRGPDIPSLATELKGRGFEIVSCDLEWDQERKCFISGGGGIKTEEADECGSFMIFDPAGNDLFFNTNAGERAPYERSCTNPVFGGTDSWPKDFEARNVPVRFHLGQLAVDLRVTDVAECMRFYGELGFSLLAQTRETAYLRYPPATSGSLSSSVPNPPYLIRKSEKDEIGIAFVCDDIAEVTAVLRKLDVEVDKTGEGVGFTDSDQRRVSLHPHP
ncbi:MAG: VOC family protein [Candidatus Latescibacteria bacterium]|jgi:catechol 2,3-dioxygenase-like lactoylglutathione lyase family enzyme|nr:VOC family protein [Candidatus Latescibacterota bacterium]